MSNQKISTGHYLYDGVVVFSDGTEQGYTVWWLNDDDARNRVIERATCDKHLTCWVKQVVKQ